MTQPVSSSPVLFLERDHVHVKSPFCGDLIEVLRGRSAIPDLAVLVDVKGTTAHFHRGFDEVYLAMEGSFTLRLFDPGASRESEHTIGRHEACVIPRGVHHQIMQASMTNRLCVICVPHFDPGDEIPSDVLTSGSARTAS